MPKLKIWLEDPVNDKKKVADINATSVSWGNSNRDRDLENAVGRSDKRNRIGRLLRQWCFRGVFWGVEVAYRILRWAMGSNRDNDMCCLVDVRYVQVDFYGFVS